MEILKNEIINIIDKNIKEENIKKHKKQFIKLKEETINNRKGLLKIISSLYNVFIETKNEKYKNELQEIMYNLYDSYSEINNKKIEKKSPAFAISNAFLNKIMKYIINQKSSNQDPCDDLKKYLNEKKLKSILTPHEMEIFIDNLDELMTITFYVYLQPKSIKGVELDYRKQCWDKLEDIWLRLPQEKNKYMFDLLLFTTNKSWRNNYIKNRNIVDVLIDMENDHTAIANYIFLSSRNFDEYLKFEVEEKLFSKSQFEDWFIDLNLAELGKLRNLFIKYKIIDNKKFANDDVVRARSLCGYFCKKGRSFKPCTPIGAGILVPGQQYNNDYYSVHTALHVFEDKKKKTYVTENIYFIPYGLPPQEEKFGLKVRALFKQDPSSFNSKQSKITMKSVPNESAAPDDNDMSAPDFALVHISTKIDDEESSSSENTDSNGSEEANKLEKPKTLKELLVERAKNETPFEGNWFTRESVALPSLVGYNEELGDQRRLRIFALGLPGNHPISLEEGQEGFGGPGFVVSMSLFNNTYTRNTKELRSMSTDVSDEHAIQPLLRSEFTSDFPSINGMSGGPLLSCHVSKNNEKKCKLIGTLAGAERIFNKNKKLKDLKSLGNLSTFDFEITN